MLNILKWDFIDYFRRHYGIYIGLAVVIIIAVLPVGPPLSAFFDGIAAIYSVFFYFFSLVVSIAVTIVWLKKNSSQLELSVPVKPWKKLLGKLILSACIIASTMLLMKLLELQAGKFGMDMYASVTVFVQYLLCPLTLSAVFMFSYITAKSFAPTRNIAGLITVLLTVGIFALLVYISSLFMHTGIQSIKVTPDVNISYPAANPDSNWTQTALSIALPAILIAVLFWGSSEFLKKRFERY